MWNAEEVEDLPEFEDAKPIPDGTMCEVMVAGADLDIKEGDDGGKKTKYALTFIVNEGEYANRKIWERYNISGHSEVGDKIGNGIFKRFMAALGKTSLSSLDELVGHSLVVRVGAKTERDGKVWNKVKSYYPVGEGGGGAPAKSEKSGTWKKPAGAKADW